ncbi:MAG: efflux RND transporter periplasmic adaptor subunit [Deltaproteobacteria bacterium]|nr:MAG: efflux RND transporter periplasmic adaptor subunit [Deltaproteobacteria bacterium]
MSTPRPTERDERLRSELASLRIDRDQAATPARRRRSRLWVTLVVLALVGLWVGLRARAGRVPEVQVVSATATAPGKAVRGTVLSGSGYVVTGEKYISIGVRVPGRIERYFVEEGQSVHAGDPLVALDDRDYRAAVAQAEAAVHTAEANLALHEADLRRISALHERHIVSRADLDTAVNRAAVDRATVAQLHAQLDQAKVQLDYTVLRAPRDGVVLAKMKEVGEIAVPGGFEGAGDLIRMANLEDLRAEIDINESDLHRIQMGQDAEVVPDAYPERAYAARVVKLYPQVNRQKGTLKIEVQIPHPDEKLLPDMSVRINFLTEARPPTPGGTVVTVPRAALREDEHGRYVWVVADGRVRRQAVTTGAELGDQVQIVDGLAGGEALATGDASRLHDGDPVRTATPAPRA